MISENLEKSLQFYQDRVKHAAVQMLKTILDDPRLSPDERANLILEIHLNHKEISDFLQSTLEKAIANSLRGVDV